MNKLTEKQELFCIDYVKTLNATQSYKNVYVNVTQKTAEVNGIRLLGNARVKARIDNLMNEIKTEKIADAKEVLELLTQVARGELTEDIVTGKGSVVYDMKPQINSRLKALDLLAKRYGLLTEKVDLNATVGVTIIDDIPEED